MLDDMLHRPPPHTHCPLGSLPSRQGKHSTYLFWGASEPSALRMPWCPYDRGSEVCSWSFEVGGGWHGATSRMTLTRTQKVLADTNKCDARDTQPTNANHSREPKTSRAYVHAFAFTSAYAYVDAFASVHTCMDCSVV